ncbi:unnamed protein product [Tilletia caries]|nr:unnamed protein product [Tilletia caries]
MPSYAQEFKLLDITGQWFCHGLDTEEMGQALSSLSLFPQATASWKAFLEYNGEFIDKKEPEEYDFSKRPCIDNSIVEAAFKQFESDSTPGNFDKILMDIKKKGQPSSRQPTSTARTSSSLGVGSKLHVPTRKGSVSPVRASTRARTQNRRYSGNFELSGDEGSRGRQGKAASPSDRSDPAMTMAISRSSVVNTARPSWTTATTKMKTLFRPSP